MTNPYLDPAFADSARAQDGTPLSFLDIGVGPAVVLLHSFASDPVTDWLTSGVAARLIDQGLRIIAPQLRGHAVDAEVTTPTPDILAQDVEDILAAKRIITFGLVGYSFGSIIAVRAMARGAKPECAVLGGIGLANVINPEPVAARFGSLAINNSALAQNICNRRLSPAHLVQLLNSVPSTSREDLAAIDTPTLVISGDRDLDHGDPIDLAKALGNGRAALIPGHHGSVLKDLAFLDLAAQFLTRLDHPQPRRTG